MPLAQNVNQYLYRVTCKKAHLILVIFHLNYMVKIPVCVCLFIPSPVRVGTLLMEVPGTPIGASFFEFELKLTGKEMADPTQHEFQRHIL